MGDPEGRKSVEWPLVCCLQAEDRGLLKGDLNIVQSVALDIANVYRNSIERSRFDVRVKNVRDIIDLYLKLNFPDTFEAVERSRAIEAEDEAHGEVEIYADSMEELFNMMQMADMP